MGLVNIIYLSIIKLMYLIHKKKNQFHKYVGPNNKSIHWNYNGYISQQWLSVGMVTLKLLAVSFLAFMIVQYTINTTSR